MRTKKRNARIERFAAEYVVDLDGTEAAIRAGYSRKSAHVTASRLLKLPEVKASLAAHQQQVVQRAEVSAERVIEELARIAFFNPKRLYYPVGHPQAGQLLSVHEMADEVAACVREQKIARANLDKTDGKKSEEWLHELKHHDKIKALELLGKHLALFKDVVEVTTDWEKLAARLASVRAEVVDPLKFLGDGKKRR